ncbi:MAG: 3'-5' exonuclease [Kiritimatiellia bacterium]|jgi:DNA polymerase-3 subunit epsilon
MKRKRLPRFTAIDFETADRGSDSACAVAVVTVEDGAIVDRAYRLIRPPRQEFEFTYIHGIRWEDVEGQPTFQEVWPALAGHFERTTFIAAHNARFDQKVLAACCAQAGAMPPRIRFECTVELARRVWSIYPTKLPDVCRRLKIPLNHHDAASDAEACARIVMAAMQDGVVFKSA